MNKTLPFDRWDEGQATDPFLGLKIAAKSICANTKKFLLMSLVAAN